MNEFQKEVIEKLAILQTDVNYIKQHYSKCDKVGNAQFGEFKAKFWWIVGIYGAMLGSIFAFIMIR